MRFPPVSRSQCISLHTAQALGKTQTLNSQTESLWPQALCGCRGEERPMFHILPGAHTSLYPPNPHLSVRTSVRCCQTPCLRGASSEPSLQAGNIKKWFSDGVTLEVREDGSQTQNNPNGARVETEPDGTWKAYGFCARPIRSGQSDKYLEALKAKRQITLSHRLALQSQAHVAHVAPSCLMLPVSCCLSHALITFWQSHSAISLQVG